jgi:hypothetical protein
LYSPQLSSNLEAGRTSQESEPLSRDDVDDPVSVDFEIQLARSAKANLLIVGPEPLVMAVVSRVVPDEDPEVIIPCRTARMQLPRVIAPSGTVVFRDVDALVSCEQRELFEWLEGDGREHQVISTASAPLRPLVEAGEFDAGLYYRLNILYIDLSA